MSLRAVQALAPHASRIGQRSVVLSTARFNKLQTVRYSTDNEPSSAPKTDKLIPTWNDYFKLRSKRRVYETLSYAPSTIIPAVGAGAYFLQLQVDPTGSIMGMHPLAAAAVGVFGAGFGGFLAGPVFADAFFKLLNRKYVPEMDQRDKEFYEHIKRNRADARLNSIRNPVPDYYGEKIKSVADYRSWLRKQREHYRKGVFGGGAADLEE
ncbi:mitochondrial import protein Pam17-domain-containing protein [Radiomyces spectabilis]|uniref:mitochondrial import protein Pam17-domain-containing protein n=1 Tax=Radiomyces spectabilis TaxID=64574 RepID=UPI00221ED9C5|nr:mitochondrial import protein Pam17-domain-containing protein [Radiomyces spectabilis]KAI8393969.1 mitochondrial import protein Pam17-domain-containing protein [Radiomyces spectabilis]